MRAAIEDNGVAVIVVPGEVLLARSDDPGWAQRPVLATRSVYRPDDRSLTNAATVLNAAEKVTILAGAGWPAPTTR